MSTLYTCHGTEATTGKRCRATATRHLRAHFYVQGCWYSHTFTGCRPCADAWHRRQIAQGTDRIVAQPTTDYDKDATVPTTTPAV